MDIFVFGKQEVAKLETLKRRKFSYSGGFKDLAVAEPITVEKEAEKLMRGLF